MRRACGCRRRAALSAARGQPVYTEAPMSPPPDNYPLLCAIESPADLRRLPAGKLPALAAELRAFLIHSVSTRGGHFAAGLGTVGVGHSSTSISAALGMAVAAARTGEDRRVVAVIGDGAMTAGMAFEALNHAGSLPADLLVILNDNDMSISENVGALSNHFAR